jgi:hypothetical protein
VSDSDPDSEPVGSTICVIGMADIAMLSQMVSDLKAGHVFQLQVMSCVTTMDTHKCRWHTAKSILSIYYVRQLQPNPLHMPAWTAVGIHKCM